MLKTQVPLAYSERRKKLMSLDPSACFIFFGNTESVRNNNVHYPFRQESHFFYLSEFTEPNAMMILAHGKSVLFTEDRNPENEVWEGERYGADRAKTIFHFDEARPTQKFDSVLDEILASAEGGAPVSKVYAQMGKNPAQDSRVLNLVHAARTHLGKGRHGQLPLYDPTTHLSRLRMVKDKLEIDNLKKAAQASVKAHLQLMKKARAGVNESELFAEFQYAALKNGGTDLGYAPIIASGWNATTLHYTHNNEMLKHGDLVLVDAGSEFNYYTADVTHTFPVSATFSPEQKMIYQKVLDTNRAVIALMKPGITYKQMHTLSVEMLTAALIEIGVLTGSVQENIESKAFRPYYPHGVGHHLGLDVHDAGLYDERGDDCILKEGMVLTVEPGLYFRERGNRFYGTGVRIEDDVLITATGSEVLTRDLPREIQQIEALRQGV